MKYCVVKRDISFHTILKLLLVPLITIVVSFLVPQKLFFFVLLAGLAVLACITPSQVLCEYEYAIEGDIFSVSLIKAKSSRKELFSCDISYLLSCTPYTDNPVKGVVITATAKENPIYIAHFSEDGKEASVLFSPSSDFINELYLFAPSRVKRI